MSTLAYAALTTTRDQAIPGTSTSKSAPGIKTYADTLAALVPAEVLTLHALILSVTTTKDGANTKISAAPTLTAAFYGLALLSMVLYVVPRVRANKWDRWDYARTAIPPLAFVCWTMMQRATAFDAAFPWVTEAPRTVVALFAGALLGLAATTLAYKADQKQP